MSEIKNIAPENEPHDIKNRVVNYWTKRKNSFSENKHEELHSYKGGLWREELLSVLPKDSGLTILDAGCGCGVFEMVLAECDYQMTGIDLTPDMVNEGNNLLKRHGSSARLMVMDAENPDFPDESFDAVISRNLTWTLPHPEKAYAEWYRILKPGGILINYDAEYAKNFHCLDQDENRIHKGVDEAMKEECHQIYHMLSISAYARPEWDAEVLRKIGFKAISADPGAGDRLYGEKDEFYMPDRMFRITAVK